MYSVSESIEEPRQKYTAGVVVKQKHEAVDNKVAVCPSIQVICSLLIIMLSGTLCV